MQKKYKTIRAYVIALSLAFGFAFFNAKADEETPDSNPIQEIIESEKTIVDAYIPDDIMRSLLNLPKGAKKNNNSNSQGSAEGKINSGGIAGNSSGKSSSGNSSASANVPNNKTTVNNNSGNIAGKGNANKDQGGSNKKKVVGTMSGYRVQVFGDGRNPATLQSRAKARGNAIVAKFPKYRGQVYTFSSSPNWYTRVGNFATSEEASRALAELKRAFPQFAAEMRVVKSTVMIK